VIGALAATALAGPTAGASADAGSPLVEALVHQRSGAVVPDTVSESALQAGAQTCPPYSRAVMDEHGLNGQVVPVTLGAQSWPLASILACLQTPVPAAAVTGVTVIDDQGVPEAGADSLIGPDDLAAPTNFADPAESPVVSDLGSSVQYDRPWRGPGDQDYLDEVVESPPLEIEVFEGTVLPVTVTPSATTVAAGSTITFTSQVSGAGANPLTYAWSFGAAAAASTRADPTVTFPTAGDWTASLQVSDGAGGGGQATVAITVTPTGSTTSTTSTTTATSPTGPAGGTDTTPGGQPTTNATTPARPATGTTTTAPKSRTASGGHHSKTTTPAHARTPAATHAATTTTSATPTTTTTIPAATSPATTPTPTTTGRAAGARHATAPRSPRATRMPPAAHHAAAPLLSGRLISDVVTLPAGSSPLVRAVTPPPTATAQLRPPSRASVASLLAGGLIVVALLALGAGRELRGRRAHVSD
jgi:hypothetical protein